MTSSTSSSGADAPAVTPTCREVVGQLVGAVDPEHAGAPDSRASFSRARVLDELAEPITTTASQRLGDLAERRLAVGGGEAEVAAARAPQRRGSARAVASARRPSRGGESVVWASSATGWSEVGQGGDVVDRLDPVDRVGGDGHRADRLLVALVADVDDLVALAGPDLHLVVDLGDERAHGVDHVAAAGPGRRDDLGRRAVGRQHDRPARRHLGDVVDEDDAEVAEAVDHELVVDDLVVAVHGRLEGPHHPGQRLDGHLHAGAEPPGAASSTWSTAIGPRLPSEPGDDAQPP